jgi:histone H3/H4
MEVDEEWVSPDASAAAGTDEAGNWIDNWTTEEMEVCVESDGHSEPTESIATSDKVLGYWGASSNRQAELNALLGLKWGEYYIPDELLDRRKSGGGDSDDDTSTGSSAVEMEEEAEEEAVYEEALACLGMKIPEPDPNESGVGETKAAANGSVLRYNAGGADFAAAAAASASLDKLPETVLHHIFLCAVRRLHPEDALPLERVCKTMHRALRAEGSFWDILVCLPGQPFKGKQSFCARERVFHSRGFVRVRKEMQSTDNVILSVLEEYEDGNSADNFRWVVSGVMAKMMKAGTFSAITGIPRLRGDTVGYLAELAQARLIELLGLALLMALHAGRDAVTKGDIMILDKERRSTRMFSGGASPPMCSVGMKRHFSASPDACSCLCPSSSGTQWSWPEDDCLVDNIIPAEGRRKIVRRLAHRAGIVKMTSSAFDLVAAEMLHLLGVLVVDAFEVSWETCLSSRESLVIPHASQSLRHDQSSSSPHHPGIDMFYSPPPPGPGGGPSPPPPPPPGTNMSSASAASSGKFLSAISSKLRKKRSKADKGSIQDRLARKLHLSSTFSPGGGGGEGGDRHGGNAMSASEDADVKLKPETAFTIVPGQIRSAAFKRFKDQGGARHVYGDTWVAGSGFTVEEERKHEEACCFADRLLDPPLSLAMMTLHESECDTESDDAESDEDSSEREYVIESDEDSSESDLDPWCDTESDEELAEAEMIYY